MGIILLLCKINKYKNEVEKIFAQIPSSWDHFGIP